MDDPILLTPAELDMLREPPPTFRQKAWAVTGVVVGLLTLPFFLLYGWARALFRRRPGDFLSEKERRDRNVNRFVIGTLLVAVGILVYGYFTAYFATEKVMTVKVLKAERVNYGDRSKYLVFTDQGVFKCTDNLWYLKFNSSDVYGTILPDRTYRLRVVGWRDNFWSWYPNILDAQPAD